VPFASGSSGGSGIGAVLYDFTITSAQPSIDTFVDNGGGGVGANLSGSYHLLEWFLVGRTNEGAVNSTCALIFNNDSAAHYDNEVLQSQDTSFNSFNDSAQNSLVFIMRGASSAASFATAIRMTCAGYAQTTFFKEVEAIGCSSNDAVSNWMRTQAMAWRSTAAITRIKVSGGGGSNLVTGSRLIIFGR
jgi:hypothetical protein